MAWAPGGTVTTLKACGRVSVGDWSTNRNGKVSMGFQPTARRCVSECCVAVPN